jgi:hypothetical protein
MTDGKPTASDADKVADFVNAGRLAQAAVDCLAITALVTAVREHVDAAVAYNAAVPVNVHRDAVRRELAAALLELGGLAFALERHFQRARRTGGDV